MVQARRVPDEILIVHVRQAACHTYLTGEPAWHSTAALYRCCDAVPQVVIMATGFRTNMSYLPPDMLAQVRGQFSQRRNKAEACFRSKLLASPRLYISSRC